jgi:oxygen-dependent protoporphyrinogen oxidase
MGDLATHLVDRLERTHVVAGQAARRVAHVSGGYQVALDAGDTVTADAVVLATPAFATADLLAELDTELASIHDEIPYASSVVVTLAFAGGEVTPLDGYGYVVPHVEGSDVLACTWSSQKWESRAPSGTALVRVYAGRFGGPDLSESIDDDLVELARAELRRVGVDADPSLTRVHRWPRGMPQYVLGHPERLARIDALVSGHPGLALAGAAYRGVGVPDCIRSGEEAAESVVRAAAGASA